MRSQGFNLRASLALLLLLSLALCALVGCKEEAVYGHCELTLDLPGRFEECDAGDAYDVAYTDGTVIVGILRISYEASSSEGSPTTLTPRKFADRYRTLALEGVETTETREQGDVAYFTYSLSSPGGKGFTYMPTFYFTPYAYFVVTYITPYDEFDGMQAELLSYAETMKIVDTDGDK